MKNSIKWVAGVVVLIGVIAAIGTNSNLQKGRLFSGKLTPQSSEIISAKPKTAQPDLIISQIKRTFQSTTNATFMVAVKNQGSIAPGKFNIDFIGSVDKDPFALHLQGTVKPAPRQKMTLSDLGPGQETMVNFTLTTNDPLLKTALAAADIGRQITESDESNNYGLFDLETGVYTSVKRSVRQLTW